MIHSLINIFIFPGLLFLCTISLAAEYLDRKLYARLQNRVGPPWFQPLADMIKLFGKEDIMPEEANPLMFKGLPLFALAAATTAFLYIPLWSPTSLFSFDCDIIVVLYLLTLPTIAFFLAGWYSTSLYAMIGAIRSLTQLFAYEVPLFLGVLAPAIIANTWSLSGLIAFYRMHHLLAACNILGFIVSIIAMQGKLEKVPFDIPEAETEIVAGSFTEYSGRLLAMFRMTIAVELVVGASLFSAVFLPFGFGLSLGWAVAVYIVKILFIIILSCLIRTLFARMRIDQMVEFCWKYLAPIALVQILINLVIKGMIR
ncbi:MAG: complex I subunit 1 family protein [Endomicrobiales bacterium]